MELMPGYKQTEVGVIPDDWETKTLLELAEGKKELFDDGDWIESEHITTKGVRLIQTGNIGIGKFIEKDERKYIYETSFVSLRCKELKQGDLLICRLAEPAGRSCVLEDIGEGKVVTSVDVTIFRPPSEMADRSFLSQVFSTSEWFKSVNDRSGGTTHKRISRGALGRLKVQIPPLLEQHAIAKSLLDVDALLATLDQMIAKKRDLKQATIQQLLTGETRLPRFTGDWGLKSFGDLFDFSGGYSASRDQLSNEGHCYLHYGDIHGSTKTCVNTRRDFLDIPKLSISLGRISESSLLKHGDVVFVDASEDDAGTSKHLVIENEDDVPFISGLHTIVAKSKTNDLAHAYKHYCFQTPAIRQQFMFYAVGTKVSGISKTNIAKLTLPIPSIPEQIAIAAVLSSMDVELATLEARRDKTRNIKQAMMQELLTGKTRLV